MVYAFLFIFMVIAAAVSIFACLHAARTERLFLAAINLAIFFNNILLGSYFLAKAMGVA